MFENIKSIKKRHEELLFAKKGVVACGIGYKTVGRQTTMEPCIVVSVKEKKPLSKLSAADVIPETIGGVLTDVQETGIIRALQNRTDRWRPAPGGVSIGHVSITAGTLGCLVARDDEIFILSNNHVLAASNAGEVGDPIIQPGTYDNGVVPDDQIATLEDFVPVEFLLPDCPFATGTIKTLNALCELVGSSYMYYAARPQQAMNLVDAAIAKPLSLDLVTEGILEVGVPYGVAEGELGMGIQKSGRTTGLTTGEILQTDVTVQVLYGSNIAMFEDQLMAGEMCAGGDSGSAVLTMDNHVVGLLFAGSETTTVFNRIQNVMSLLNVVI